MGVLLEYVIVCSALSSLFGLGALAAAKYANISEKSKSRLLFWSQVSPYAALPVFFVSVFIGGSKTGALLYPRVYDTVFIVWAAAAFVLIIRLLVEYAVFMRRLNRSRKFLFKKGDTDVYGADIGGTPFTAGIVSPAVYFPQKILEGASDGETELMLAHECTHLKSLDLHKKLILALLECLNWFNPFYCYLTQKTVLQMEYACDESVAEQLSFEERKKYALALLRSAENSLPAPMLPTAGFSARAENLQRRIKTFMEKENNNTPKKRTGVKSVIVGMVALSLSVCVCASSYLSRADEAGDRLIYSKSDSGIYQRSDGSLYAEVHGCYDELSGYYIDKDGFLGYDDPATGERTYAVSIDWDNLSRSYNIGASGSREEAIKFELSDNVITSEPTAALALDGRLIRTQEDGVEFYLKEDKSVYFIIDGKATTVSNSREEMYFLDDEGYIVSLSLKDGKAHKVYLEHITNTEPGWFSAGACIDKSRGIRIELNT